MFFFVKQKTAYEVRISDWSSDVCSSDLLVHAVIPPVGSGNGELAPAASFEGTLSRGIAAEVLAGFPRNGTFGIARADVMTGGALPDFERQELAAVGQGQLAERGLLGPGRAPLKRGAEALPGRQPPPRENGKREGGGK